MNETEYWYSRSCQDRLYGDLQHEATMIALNQTAEYNLFATLKPSIFKDGNQWRVLLGKDLMEGVCGFGNTPYLAILDFNKAFHAPARG